MVGPATGSELRRGGEGVEIDRLPALSPGSGDLWDRMSRGELTEAEYALATADQLLRPRPSHARVRSDRTSPDTNVTMVLRDLALRVPDLDPGQQRLANALLARPTSSSDDPTGRGYLVPAEAACTDTICFHWVTTTVDAPPMADTDGDEIPDWLSTTAAEVGHVWETLREMGYRPPKDDSTSLDFGLDGRFDVYLKDLGPVGVFGYCATDDPDAEVVSWDVSAYCVLDNDFARDQYGPPPLRSLQATAAHEVFHAVQYAYDVREDFWMMESTASWMAEHIYPDANVNQGLRRSALAAPRVPLDYGQDGFEYGNWIFWEFLAQYFGSRNTNDPTIVRDMWRLADGRAGAPDLASLPALRRVLQRRGESFPQVFSSFGAFNKMSRDWYRDGRSYPQNQAAATRTLTPASPSTGWRRQTLHHLSNVHVVLRPGKNLRGAWRIAIDLDLPPRFRGSAASAVVNLRDGRVRAYDLILSRKGDVTVRFPFARGTVGSVVLTLTNASTRYACWEGTPMTCQGYSRDDALAHWYRARLVR